MVIIIGGLFFGVRENSEFTDYLQSTCIAQDNDTLPIRADSVIRHGDLLIKTVAEIKDAGIVKEIISKLEKRGSSNGIDLPILLAFLIIAFGTLIISVLPSVFPWTDIILSRYRIIRFIHLKDGQK